jgi:hypothetical protein
MYPRRSSMRKRSQERVVDEMISAYADWREASRLVDDAYHSWASAGGVRARAEFVRYTAALDSEEFAADAYADLVRRVGGVVPSDASVGSQAWGDPWP